MKTFERQARCVSRSWRHPLQRTMSGRDEFIPLFHRNDKQHRNPSLKNFDFMPDLSGVAKERLGSTRLPQSARTVVL